MWIKSNYGRGQIVDLSKCKTITPAVEKSRDFDINGKDQKPYDIYYIYADDIIIFWSKDKEVASLTFDWLLDRILGAKSITDIARQAVEVAAYARSVANEKLP